MRGQLHELELVYPPISNREAEWIKDDPGVQELLKHSNIYFIGQKPEAFFEFSDDLTERLQTAHQLYFTYSSGLETNLFRSN